MLTVEGSEVLSEGSGALSWLSELSVLSGVWRVSEIKDQSAPVLHLEPLPKWGFLETFSSAKLMVGNGKRLRASSIVASLLTAKSNRRALGS